MQTSGASEESSDRGTPNEEREVAKELLSAVLSAGDPGALALAISRLPTLSDEARQSLAEELFGLRERRDNERVVIPGEPAPDGARSLEEWRNEGARVEALRAALYVEKEARGPMRR